MTTFETIQKHETKFQTGDHRDDFLQVTEKIARSDTGNTQFYALTRGYLDAQGSRRYKTNLTLPDQPWMAIWTALKLLELVGVETEEIQELQELASCMGVLD